MDKLERIHELMDEMMAVVSECWPEATTASFTVYADGYRGINVERWETNKELPVEAWKRRMIFDQHRVGNDGEWSEDRSEEHNDYLKRCKVLLEDRKGA